MTDALRDVLTGTTVVELASGVPGGLAGRRLADLGATVLKYEDADGDWLREAAPTLPGTGTSAVFAALHRGKDLRRLPEDPAEFADVVASAAVFLTDRSAEWLAEAGLGAQLDATRRGETAAVWVLLSAHGPDGPWRDLPGSELTLQAATGYTGYLGDRTEPTRLSTGVGEAGTAIFAVQAVLAAHFARAARGVRGQVVTVSTMQTLLSLASIQVAAKADPDDYLGPRVGGEFYPPQRGWRCKDGQITFAFGGAVGQRGRPGWTDFVTELGGEWMLGDPRFDASGSDTTGLGVRVEQTRADYERLFADRTCAELVEKIRQHGGSAARYQTLDEAVRHPQTAALGILEDTGDPDVPVATRFPGIPRG